MLGNQLMSERQQEDDDFLGSLGMTREEYYEEIYFDMLMYSKTLAEYCKFYYSGSGLYDGATTFEDYIDDGFSNASVPIVTQ
jgi:hypothetical protein